MLSVPVSCRSCEEPPFALIDEADLPLVSQFNWHRHDGYVRTWLHTEQGRRGYEMHRLILGLPPGRTPEVDHINRVKHDNQRTNLRVGTHALNAQNRAHAGGVSTFRGVSFHPQSNSWCATVKQNGAFVFRKYFRTETDAARAAHEARQRYLVWAED